MKEDKQDKDSETYIGILQPIEIRRPLLEAAKASIETGKIAEKIKEIEEAKLKTRSDLAHKLKEVRDELSKLQMVLPPREVRDTPAVLPPVKRKVLDHRIDKIESALSEIERRLKTL